MEITTYSNEERILLLWGKTQFGKTGPSDYHPALFHMLDVAHVSQYLLGKNTSPRFINLLANSLNVQPETLVDWIPYLIALHDIGKISIAFQKSNEGQKKRLTLKGFSFATDAQQDMHHSLISQIYVEGLTNIAPKVLQSWGEALGGHHGRFSHPDEVKKGRAKLSNESDEWNSLRESADKVLQNKFLKYDLSTIPEPSDISVAIMAINGFAILCDWIGSDSRYFQLKPNLSFDKYINESKEKAKLAVEKTGLTISSTSEASTDVQSLFSDLTSLRALQTLIDEIPTKMLENPTLSIIEAPTGEGKTEAALALAHRIGQVTGIDDMYYALPTTATSNQMFGRLQEHLKNRLRLSTLVKLVHGQAYLTEDDLRAEFPVSMIKPLENGEASHKESADSLIWFNSKKRALLAPFGVGTIDQAELAVLNVKHVGLRMAGLIGKVIIIDEVHAYDTYMTTIIERLLRWLSSMSTSVILLSATLPISRRKQLAEAYCTGVILDEQANRAYPNFLVMKNRLLDGDTDTAWTPNQEIKVWQPNRVLEISSLHFADDNEQVLEKAKWLIEQTRNGGCACWITNTVKRSQNIFKALYRLKTKMLLDVELDLIHSQFPLAKRQDKETQLNDKYGRKGDKRPRCGIVVGTQVLEQSLDLDFDVMVSDLAPIDLLLQRAGRLHRHERNRPLEHEKLRLYVNFEIDGEDSLMLGNDRKIYDEYIIRATHRELVKRIFRNLPIILPADYRVLIEGVYTIPDENDSLYSEWCELLSKESGIRLTAKEKLLPEPHPRDSFAKTAAMKVKFEEDENNAAWIVAQTRLGEESLNVIPLERDGDWAYLDGENKINVKVEASIEIQLRILKYHLRVSDPDAIKEIRDDAEENGTALFKKSALLKDYFPIWLSKGEAYLPKGKPFTHIKLDSALGLTIEKEKKRDGKKK
jgi:CRISPR-associated endonuclease/helicase Cas3